MATEVVASGVAASRLSVNRWFTQPDTDPYDSLEWERRDAQIGSGDKVAFRQEGVEFPKSWSLTASNIVAQKYFRGKLKSPEREYSLRQLIGRVVNKITDDGVRFGYFDAPTAAVFAAELTHILLHQMASFNSPVWFNIGAPGRPQTASACFILDVQDNMESIEEWVVTEAEIFRAGSGSGVNLSRLREDKALLSRGGTASGPISFMRWTDAGAGAIKSGGGSRRAAKMVILDIDHPDIEEFIECKAREEMKIRVLREAGFEVDFDGKDTHTLGFQNANNSARLSDDFLHAVEADGEWNLISRVDGHVTKTVRARDLMNTIAAAAHACADPGLQFDTTINNWNTTPHLGKLEASNPCLSADTLVLTERGQMSFSDLLDCYQHGQMVRVWTSGVDGPTLSTPDAVMVTGVKEVFRLTLSNLFTLKCTADHKVFTQNRGWIAAQYLTPTDQVATLVKNGEEGWINGVAYLTEYTSIGEQVTYDLTEPKNHSFIANGVIVHNCAEHIRRNNSSCNLASINLLKFLNDDGTFDLGSYSQVIRVVFTAMDILISGGEFPTEKIKEVTHQDRDLGLGYCNLGALLMAKGLPYDSDDGRAYAAALTTYMTATAYQRSSEMAAALGAHPTFDAKGAGNVMEMHTVATRKLCSRDDNLGDVRDLTRAAWETWEEVVSATSTVGLRNAQATLIAPTGTISFMMDADTTGMEPDLSLKKTKKLVGGGSLSIVNQTVPRALKVLGYRPDQIHDIVAYIDANSSVVDAPHLDPRYYPVFATSMGDNSISPMGHVKMMAALQPGLAGAQSKTVNLPSTATVDDVFNTYMEAWRLGVKCIALYVENSKVAQPMTVDKKTAVIEKVVEKVVERPSRHRLPQRRPSTTTSFRMLDPWGSITAEGYLNAGEYPDTHELGEIFVKVAKQGSTLAGVMDAFAIAVSIGLQYGVPVRAFVEKFVNMRFEPNGGVDDPDFMGVTSIMDYLFRRLAADYLTRDERQSLGILTIADRRELLKEMPVSTSNGHGKEDEKLVTQIDAPMCYSCGIPMQQAGSCYTCSSCGSTSGCS